MLLSLIPLDVLGLIKMMIYAVIDSTGCSWFDKMVTYTSFDSIRCCFHKVVTID